MSTQTETALVGPVTADAGRGRVWPLVLVFVYFLSGLTGIAYEVLWVRMLGLQFGVSNFGMVITVAAFMAGLGAGSLTGITVSRRIKYPLLVFAMLEGAVAVGALAMPGLFQGMEAQLVARAKGVGLETWYAMQAAASFAVLFVPAMAMGMAFPLVLRALADTRISVGKVYGINTLGGAFGALLPLASLPAVGWIASLYAVVAISVVVTVLALLLIWPARRVISAGEVAAEGRDESSGSRPHWLELMMYAGVGAAVLMLEVGWARLYGMILLRTEYVLGVVLCVFLAGTGLGSVMTRARAKPSWLFHLPWLAALFALLSLWAVPLLARWADQREYGSLADALVSQGVAIALLTLPATFLFGAWLPLLSARLAQGGRVAGAWFYGANSIGAACGALVAGFVLVPWVGTAGAIIVAALLLFACGAVLAGGRRLWMAMPLLLLAAFPVMRLPPVNGLLPVTQAQTRDLAVYEDALTVTHVVEQADGQRLLLADLSWMDASSDPTAVAVQKNQARLPLLLHPSPQRVLFLGLGTGISASGALAFPGTEITSVELSQGAISAARDWFSPVNGGVMDKAAGVIRDDARRYLSVDERLYDVIIGDLFHPDLAGRGNLLSVQQFQRARTRLAPGGLFAQWLAVNQFDARTLDIVLRSFKHVFPKGMIFIDGLHLALVGPRDDWPGAPAMLARALSPRQWREGTGGEGEWTWLGRYWGEIPESQGPVQDEWRPKIEFMLPRARYTGAVDMAGVLDYVLALRPTVEEAGAALRVSPAQMPGFERAYVATELAVRSWQALIRGQPQEGQRLLRMAYEANPDDRWIGFALADQMLMSLPGTGRDERMALQAVLMVRPDHVGALKALRRIEAASGNKEAAEGYARQIAALSPLERETP